LSSPLNLSPGKIKRRTRERSALEVNLPKMEGRNLAAAKTTGNADVIVSVFKCPNPVPALRSERAALFLFISCPSI
ncbi:hypothetical protein MUK42_34941, partial [Musa troglodytarum]